MSFYETKGGVPSRSDTYAKLLDLLRQAQSQAAMMAHLHQINGNQTDTLLAKGWLGIEQLLNVICKKITELAMGKLQ